ncbi:MAG: sigma-70 family RNA polymerase sigma factor [Anaerolineae bacterium]|nr:sigma-70 family RNA polymerase sigma factor [Anaerolineae bacterium]
MSDDLNESLISAQDVPETRTRADDVTLAKAVASGNTRLIESFCTIFANDIARYARRFVSRLEAEELEDITQTVLITAVTNIETYRGDSSLKTWVLRIAHHKLVDAVRHREVQDRRESVFAAMPDTWEPEWPEQPEDIVIGDEEKRRVNDALNRLPERERAVLTLRYIQDMDTQEIAQVINLSHRLTQKILTQGRKRIRAFLGMSDESEED